MSDKNRNIRLCLKHYEGYSGQYRWLLGVRPHTKELIERGEAFSFRMAYQDKPHRILTERKDEWNVWPPGSAGV